MHLKEIYYPEQLRMQDSLDPQDRKEWIEKILETVRGDLIGIFWVDVDDTLTTNTYALTVPDEKLRTVIQNLKENQRIWLILNSDTPVERLSHLSSRWGFLEDITIGEYGNVIKFWRYKILLRERKQVDKITTMREAILTYCDENKELQCLVGDSKKLLECLNEADFWDKEHVVIVDNLRTTSLNFYIRHLQDGKIIIDPLKSMRIVRDLLSHLEENTDLSFIEIDENYQYGIVILHLLESSKQRGSLLLNELLNEWNEELFIKGMLGNSINDLHLHPYFIKRHFLNAVVGNAPEELKRIVKNHKGIVAKKPYTEGVIEILSAL